MNARNLRKEDIEAGIALLEQQIATARVLLNHRPLNKKMCADWTADTRNCLAKIYGPDSPNVRSLETTVGATPIWMGMPPEVSETYAASRLERTVSMLESCTVALKLKAVHPKQA
jgi:hypothetical protein